MINDLHVLKMEKMNDFKGNDVHETSLSIVLRLERGNDIG